MPADPALPADLEALLRELAAAWRVWDASPVGSALSYTSRARLTNAENAVRRWACERFGPGEEASRG